MKLSIRLGLFVSLFISIVGAAAFADPPSYSLGDVTITATRIAQPISTAPADVTVITAAEIRASGAQTIAGAIKNAADVSVTSYGSNSADSTVSIRGSTSSQVLVMVDGVPMNDPLTGSVDLSTIPIDDVARIEIVRSGASALYGTAAIGGVINIITKRSTKPSLTASIENGSYLPGPYQSGSGASQSTLGPDYASLIDTQRASLQASGSIGSLGLRAAGSFVRAQNGYLYLDPNNQTRQLQNAGLLGGNGSLGLSLPLLSGTLSADAYALYHASGVPGIPGTPTEPFPYLTPDARETQSIYRGVLRYSTPHLGSDLLSLDLTAYATQSEVTYIDPGSATNDNHMDSVFGAQVQQNASLSDLLTLVYGSSFSYERAVDTEAGTPHRLTAGAFIEPVLSIGALSLYPAVRYDFYSDYAPGALSFILGASYQLGPKVALKANISRSYRAPDFNDLYYQSPYFVGNPNLSPETAWNADFGLQAHVGPLRYSLSGFARYAQDQIVDLPEANNPSVYRAVNYGLALFPGVDQEAKLTLGDHLTFDMSYTFLFSFALFGGLTLQDNIRMPMTPVHTVTGRLAYRRGPLSGSLAARYESLQYLDTSEVSSLPGFLVVDAIVRYAVNRQITLYLAADNLLDAQYQVVAGYPMPPTFIKSGVDAHF